MTYFYYKTSTWNSQPQVSEDQIKLWKHLAEKKELEDCTTTKWFLPNRIQRHRLSL